VFVLSGEVDTGHTTQLAVFLATEVSDRVTLDLKNATLVDRAAVRFLADAEVAGVRIVNCPEYVRSWIAAERDWQETRPHESEIHEPES
jgi:hypothetical protein